MFSAHRNEKVWGKTLISIYTHSIFIAYCDYLIFMLVVWLYVVFFCCIFTWRCQRLDGWWIFCFFLLLILLLSCASVLWQWLVLFFCENWRKIHKLLWYENVHTNTNAFYELEHVINYYCINEKNILLHA